MGVEKFNDACRTSVLKYTKDWERYVTRQARWVDFANDYKTLDPDYMESVMWAFKTLYDKGLVYEGFRVLAYCYRCETPLSNTETRMDDVYRDRQDPTLTVWFRRRGGPGGGERAAARGAQRRRLDHHPVDPAVQPGARRRPGHRVRGPDQGRQSYVVGAARLEAYAKELDDFEQVGTVLGRDLVGRRYTPLYDFLVEHAGENAYQVLGADFVTTEDGTGVVHLAPAFGEDDQNVCNAAGIPTIVTVDDHTRFTALVPTYQGVQVFDANKPIIRELKDLGVVLRQDTYSHSYPHCWRCDTPLVYKAVSSWFVAVTKFRDRMVELNQEINWTPSHVKDGSFGKWLANARDWSISRNRFWGSPIPVWKSDDPNYPRVDVYGSIEQLEARFRRDGDRHAPAVHR